MTIFAYTTAALIQAEIRATAAFSASSVPTADTIATWIAEESAQINHIAGEVIGTDTYTETLDYNGEDRFLLRHAPVQSVTSVLYSTAALGNASYALDQTQVDGTDYTAYTDEGEIVILPSGWQPAEGRKRIQVNYVAGNPTTPLIIQKLATKKVAKRVIDSLLEKDINEKASGKSISVGSISIVKPSDFGVKQYTTLTTDIDQLEMKLISGTSVYRLPTHRY